MSARNLRKMLWILLINSMVPGMVAVASTAPNAVLKLDDISRDATARLESIQSIHIDYDATWKVIQNLPGFSAAEPRRLTTRFMGERRYFQSVPLNPLGPAAPYLVLYDDDATLTCDIKGALQHGTRISGAFLSRGRLAVVDRDDLYVHEVLGIPLSDSGRALWESGWNYPYCLSRKPNVKYVVHEKQEMVDDAWCHVVEAKGWDRMWVDARLGGAVRRRERYFSSDEPFLSWRSKDSDFIELKHGLWVPRKHVRETFAPPQFVDKRNQVVLELSLDVHEISVNDVSAKDFAVSLPAGVMIGDTDHGTYFRAPGSFDQTIHELARQVRVSTFKRAWWPWFAGILLGIIAAAFAVWWRRKTFRGHS